jgi:hypothetical protein
VLLQESCIHCRIEQGYDVLVEKPELMNLNYAKELFAQAHQGLSICSIPWLVVMWF